MYTLFGIHYRKWVWLFSPLAWLFRIKIYPNSITKEFFDAFADKSIIYVLPRMSIIDIIVLNKTLKKLKQKKIIMEAKPGRFKFCAFLALKPRNSLFINEDKEGFIYDVLNLIASDPRAKSNKLIFMPVSVFWSRAPDRDEKGFILKSLFPDDGTGNALQKLFMLLLHRGEVNVTFGKNVALHPPIAQDNSGPLDKKNEIEKTYILRLRRLFNIQFAKDRTAAFGPMLYDIDKITQWILSTPSTKEIINSSENQLKAQKKIASYISEISANYNYLTIRALEKIFSFVWNNLFEGVNVRNFESIESFAKNSQIIWMPSHRSHFDYILLADVLFKKGLVTPYAAAGINLNFWPIGPILRRAGAFFIRRSFSGNKLYAHTFSEYVNFLLQNSNPIEFFHEGGRSRIGKLLTPKLGMLSICVQSIISRKAENTYFIPLYFGYDKVMEDDTYARELKGAKKKKENALHFLNGLSKVFSNHGSVDVSFGEPLRIADVWDEYYEKLSEEAPVEINIQSILPKKLHDIPEDYARRDARINGFIKYLSKRINQKINGAATASGTAILTTALLAKKSNQISAEELKFYVILLHWIANKFGEILNWRIATNSTETNIFDYLYAKLKMDSLSTGLSKEEMAEKGFQKIENIAVQYFKMGERWQLMHKSLSPVNSHDQAIYSKNNEKEFNLWWYRGTIFHVYCAFSIVAFSLLNSKDQVKIPIQPIKSQLSLIRYLWQEELFWDNKTSSFEIVKCCLNIFEKLDFLVIEESYVTLNSHNNALKSLQFIVDIIYPERELYGLQATAAIELLEQKGHFLREELVQKTLSLHTKAYSQNLVNQPPIFSKIFANRIFDSYYTSKFYTPTEGQRLTIDSALLGPLEGFLEISKFSLTEQKPS